MKKRKLKINRRKSKQQNSNFDIFMSIIKFPFRHPVLFFILILLLMGTFLVLINRRIITPNYKRGHTPIRNSHAVIIEQIEERCQKIPFPALNKVRGVRLDMIEKEYYPAICVQDLKEQGTFSETCNALISDRKTYMSSPHFELFKQLVLYARELATKQFEVEFNLAQKEFDAIYKDLSHSQQQEKFKKNDDKITFLIYVQIQLSYANENKGGSCGEHSFSSIYDILKIGQDNKLIIIIKHVIVKSNNGELHGFVVINENNGDNEDILIENDATKTSAYLKNLNGYICDTWNEGFFEYATESTNMIYKGRWDSIRVETVSLDFDYQDLPEPAVKYLDNQLAKIGLTNLHGNSTLACA